MVFCITAIKSGFDHLRFRHTLGLDLVLFPALNAHWIKRLCLLLFCLSCLFFGCVLCFVGVLVKKKSEFGTLGGKIWNYETPLSVSSSVTLQNTVEIYHRKPDTRLFIVIFHVVEARTTCPCHSFSNWLTSAEREQQNALRHSSFPEYLCSHLLTGYRIYCYSDMFSWSKNNRTSWRVSRSSLVLASLAGGSDDTWTESEEVPEDDNAVRWSNHAHQINIRLVSL